MCSVNRYIYPRTTCPGILEWLSSQLSAQAITAQTYCDGPLCGGGRDPGRDRHRARAQRAACPAGARGGRPGLPSRAERGGADGPPFGGSVQSLVLGRRECLTKRWFSETCLGGGFLPTAMRKRN